MNKHLESTSIWRRAFGALALLLAMAGCGGGGGDDPPPDQNPPASQSGEFTVTGVVVGLDPGPMTVSLTVYLADGTAFFDDIQVGNGPFAFARPVPAGSEVVITVSPRSLTPAHTCRPTSQVGFVEHDYAGRQASVRVVGVQSNLSPLFFCGPGHRLSGTATGSVKSASGAALLSVLVDGQRVAFDPYAVDVPGPWQLTETFLLPGEVYEVLARTSGCRVTNGTGVMPNHDVEGIQVHCGIRRVRYEVIGLVGTGLQVTLASQPAAPGSPPVQESRSPGTLGADEFETGLGEGDPYSVTVTMAPSNPTQECTVENGSGTVGAEDVTNVVVRCEDGLRRDWGFFRGSELVHSDVAELGVVDVQFEMPEFAGLPRNNKKMGELVGITGLDIYEHLFHQPGTNMTVFSNETGKTYWIATEAATGQTERTIELRTRWWIRKDADDAKFTLQITDIWLDAVVDAAGSNPGYDHDARMLRSSAQVSLSVSPLLPGSTEPGPAVFYLLDTVSVTATPDASGAIEDFHLAVLPDSQAFNSIFSAADFDNDITWVNRERTVGYTKVSLKRPIDIQVDLSSVRNGQSVLVVMVATVSSKNAFSKEGHTVAYFRDPAQFDPGTSDGGVRVTQMSGISLVRPQALPPEYRPLPAEVPAPACAAPGAPRARLQFGAVGFRMSESDLRNQAVTITRTGSTVGEVTARVRMTPGTATAGADYTAREFFVRFPDGQSAPRGIVLPLIDDTLVEGPETLQLSLEDVSGCADPGPQANATVTLLDDETLVPSQYTIGGTITGLAGSGLVIENIATDPLPITAGGAFQFPRVFAAGHIYRIQVPNQPQNPRQSCTVANGEGTITNASITNVQISCTTLPDSGSLDPGFGTGGRAWSTDLSVTAHDTALARQADGKLLMVAGGNRLQRLLPNGSPDPTFGTAGDGAVVVTTGQRVAYNLVAVAVQQDGGIVVAGFAPSGVSGRADMLVARYDANGALDTSFAGGQGIATFDFGTWNDGVADLVLQADGSILLVGSISDASGSGATDFAVLRLTAGGQIDTSYGASGWARANVAGGYDVPWAGALTADGGLVVVGRVAASGGSNADIGIVKFTATGVPDTAFGASGTGVVRPITSAHEEARDVLVLADGKILVVGRQEPVGATKSIWLARYLPNGQLDNSFGTQGVTTIAANLDGTALASKPDGSILVAGELLVTGATQADYGIARFTPQGQPDATFGSGGVLGLDFYGGYDLPGAMLLQPDGLLLVAGKADNGSSRGRGLARLVP